MKHGNAFHNGIFPGTHGADTVVSSTRIRAQIMTGIIGLWFLSPSTFGALRTDISTGLMTGFPMNLIPTFFLPLFILLHMLGLVRSRELTRAPR